MKKTGKILIMTIVLLLTVTFVSGCGNNQAEQVADLPEGAVFSRMGTTEALEVDLSSKIAGRIENIAVAEGQDVKKGDLLFTMETKDVDVKKKQVMAQISAYEAVLAQAEEQCAYLQDKKERVTPLLEAGALPQDQYDELNTKLNVALLQRAAASEQVAGAYSVLEEVQQGLDETEIFAPIDGMVTMIIAEEGEIIGAGMPVITVTDYRDAWVNVNVPEDEIGRVISGASAEVKTYGYEESFAGTVVSVNRSPDFAIQKSTNELDDRDTVSFTVKIKLDTEDQVPYPGMQAEVTVFEVPAEPAA